MARLKLGDLLVFLKGDKSDLTRTMVEAKAEVAAGGAAMQRSSNETATSVAADASRAFTSWQVQSRQARVNLSNDIEATRANIRRLATEFGRTRNQSLLGDLDTERSKLRTLEQALKDLGTEGFRTATTGAGAFMSAIGSAMSGVTGVIPILLGVIAAISAIGPLGVLLGGVLGAIPALATGAIAALGALGLGAIGLSEAFQQTSASGQSVVDRAHQIALAERRLTDANREATDAQDALNRARQTAAERMEDLNRNLVSANLDQESAVNAVADAERELLKARMSENPERIARADLAYRRAQQSLADVRDRVEDLQKEQADAAAKGVEGSDEVKAALDRQRHAVEGISDAHYDLNKAQTETSGGAVKQATQIAASAQAAVDMIKSLKDKYNDLRLDVQQRLFAGVDQEILGLSDAWLPTLRTRLGSMADMFNGLFKKWAETSKKPEFIANISTAWGSVEGMIDKIGTAVAGPGLEAFGKLAAAAKPFIDELGDGIGHIVDDFARWIDEADKDGSLDQFFKDAANFLRDAGAIGADIVSIFGSIIAIMANASKEASQQAGPGMGISGFRESMDKLAAWFADPANQEKVSDFVKKISDFVLWVKDVAIPTVESWIDKISGWVDRIKGWVDKAREFRDGVTDAFNSVKNAVSEFHQGIANLNPFESFKSSFRETFNWIIDKWNGLEFSLGPVKLSTPNIQRLAQGAYIPPTPGGSLAVMAEAGQPEWALPDDKLQAALDQAVARGVAGGDGAAAAPSFDVHVYIGEEELRGLVRVEVREVNRGLKGRVLAGAGTR